LDACYRYYDSCEDNKRIGLRHIYLLVVAVIMIDLILIWIQQIIKVGLSCFLIIQHFIGLDNLSVNGICIFSSYLAFVRVKFS